MRAAPDDFYACERLDYALSTRHEWLRILEMWNAYLARHPEDARAHTERGGTLMQLGQRAQAHAEALLACELGSNAACGLAKRF